MKSFGIRPLILELLREIFRNHIIPNKDFSDYKD